MADKTFTLKQLYQFVEQYHVEVQKDGTTPSVGDFVDFLACQDGLATDIADQTLEQLKEMNQHLKEIAFSGSPLSRLSYIGGGGGGSTATP